MLIRGITVAGYSAFTNGVSSGVHITLGYTDQGSGFKNINWVQTIHTNVPHVGEVRTIYNDPQPPDDNLPFYYTNKEIGNFTNVDGFTSEFVDNPSRYNNAGNVYWNATLQFVGVVGRTYYPIITINYGFQINNGQISLSPITISTPVQPSVTFSPFFPERY